MFTVFAGEMYLLVKHNFNSGSDSNNDLSTMSISVKMDIDLASKGGSDGTLGRSLCIKSVIDQKKTIKLVDRIKDKFSFANNAVTHN